MTLEIFKNFWKRRISIPVKWNDIVLDIGSGDKPHWRADLLLENYPEEDFALQRSAGGKATVSAPMVIGDIQKLPFKDKSIDFIIASHVLEHIPDIKTACQEIQRVGKAGYIELPYEGMAKILDLDSHLWWCRKEGRTLIFTAKENFHFDDEINKYAQELNNRNQWFSKIVHPNFDISVVQLWWEESFEIQTHNTPSPEFIKKLQTYDSKNFKPIKTWNQTFRKLIIGLTRILFWHKTRKEKLNIKNLLVCPQCHSENIKIMDKKIPKPSNEQHYVCQKCHHKIKIKN